MPKTQPEKKRYVLFDRDGTIMVDKIYQTKPELTELLPGATQGLGRLAEAGFGLVVITNQSGIARGLLTERDLAAVHGRLEAMLAEAGIRLDGVYHCPHRPEDDCRCRKPLPGMAERAAADLGFSLERCVVVGDRECDMELAKGVGATAVLVRTGGGRETEANGECQPDYVADDLLDAAEWIINNAGERQKAK